MSAPGAAPLAAPARRAGVTPTAVRPATIERLEWIDIASRPAREAAAPGEVERAPVARGRDSTLHRALDHDGEPAFVRRAAPDLVEAFGAGHAAVADLEPVAGLVVPALRDLTPGELWIERRAWAPAGQAVADEPVDAYVSALLRVALRDGLIVGTGDAHVLPDGRLVCEDVLVARRLEVDERAVLASVLAALVGGDPTGLADAVAELCRARPPRLPGAAVRATLSLRAEWTPVSFGLSLHHVACAAADAGPRSEPLVLLADELLHRLDLAHHHQARIASLATRPRAAACLLTLERTP